MNSLLNSLMPVGTFAKLTLATLASTCLSLVLIGCGQAAQSSQDSKVDTRPAATNDPSSKLPKYEIRIDPKEWRALERNPDSDETHPATFIADGVTYTNVAVRFRGEWARSWPKKPLKIFFSRSQPFQGHHRTRSDHQLK